MKNLERLLSIASKVTLPESTPLAAKRDSVGEVYIYRPIGPSDMGGISAEDFVAALAEIRGVETLAVHVNSIGGGVFDGIAIYNAIQNFPAKEKIIYVDALAASAASFICMAGTKCVMAPEAQMMIHLPNSICGGSSSDMRAMADLLDKATESLLAIYGRKTGIAHDQIKSMLDAETWMNAQEAVDQKFADEVLGQEAMPKKKRMMAASAPAPTRIAAAYSATRRRIADAEVAVARIVADSMKRK